ncbi:O-methyltransferase [Tropicibacter sp. Alg240-R139]|uniref:O-methyltransferase n=1 Tax=Tropicibacter sp. Alg240-R139 TaxID=2305991 RepID=UPI0013DF4519|nr:class I SAM-dependent methyltransferase [Tropicibacter sp. Alg240-R139]
MSVVIKPLRVTDKSRMAEVFERYPEEQDRFDTENVAVFDKIETAVYRTMNKGKLPLWSAYKRVRNYGVKVGQNPKRDVEEVRTQPDYCRFYAWLAAQTKPEAVLEFGSGFGVSGMYWLAGMKYAGGGTLFSFEPNRLWTPIVRDNFASVGGSYDLTEGTFEGNLERITTSVEIALIDGIHTRYFVRQQLALIEGVAAKGAIVLIDGINFSDSMKKCWGEIQAREDFVGVWEVGARVGVVELPSSEVGIGAAVARFFARILGRNKA